MPVLVVKFPEDKGKKVNMSRFLSKYIKREFSVIVDVAEEDLSHIFKVLNRNQCKVIIAKDKSLRIDFETFFLLYVFTSKFRKDKMNSLKDEEIISLDKKNDEVEFNEIGDEEIFKSLIDNEKLKKMYQRYQKDPEPYLTIFKKELIITKDNKLLFDWDYRLRVVFDTISISVWDLNKEINKLEQTNDLHLFFKIILAIDSGNQILADIANFIGKDDVSELDELLKLEIIHRNPYRLSKHGEYILNKVIKQNLKKKLSYKLHPYKEKILEDLRNTEYARILCNLLTILSLLAIKNRKEMGKMDYDKFQELIFNPISIK